jgi:hypothetical protein
MSFVREIEKDKTPPHEKKSGKLIKKTSLHVSRHSITFVPQKEGERRKKKVLV